MWDFGAAPRSKTNTDARRVSEAVLFSRQGVKRGSRWTKPPRNIRYDFLCRDLLAHSLAICRNPEIIQFLRGEAVTMRPVFRCASAAFIGSSVLISPSFAAEVTITDAKIAGGKL